MKVVILENIRSAYNVGNIIRTADAFGWEVWLTGYTPSPYEIPKVKKTSLGAEETVGIKQFSTTLDAIAYAKSQGMEVIAAEIVDGAIKLDEFVQKKPKKTDIAIIFGNEVDGVLATTLKMVDTVVYIPMQGIKESLNVGQTSAIFMYVLS